MLELLWTTLSISGAILNAKMFRIGFLVWIVANTGWIYANITWGLYSQIPIWIVYNAICVMGWFAWKDKESSRSLKEWIRKRLTATQR